MQETQWKGNVASRLTAYGEPSGPSNVAFHANRSDSSTKDTLMPAGGDVLSSDNSCSYGQMLVSENLANRGLTFAIRF